MTPEYGLFAVDLPSMTPALRLSHLVFGPWILLCPSTREAIRIEEPAPTLSANRWRSSCPSCNQWHTVQVEVVEDAPQLVDLVADPRTEALDLRQFQLGSEPPETIIVGLASTDAELFERDREGNEPDSMWVYVEPDSDDEMPLWGGWEGLYLADELIERLVQWARRLRSLGPEDRERWLGHELLPWQREGRDLVAELRATCPGVDFYGDDEQLGL